MSLAEGGAVRKRFVVDDDEERGRKGGGERKWDERRGSPFNAIASSSPEEPRTRK